MLCLWTFQVAPGATKVLKGMDGNVESYSAFWDYAKTNETPLRKDLIKRNITDVFVCGIATDFCVGKYLAVLIFSVVLGMTINNYINKYNCSIIYFFKQISIKYSCPLRNHT